MLAQFEAFAVKHGVPAVATAHAVYLAVEAPAPVRIGIEQFILAAVAVEVGDAHADEANGHAACKRSRQQVFCSDEQLTLVIGGARQAQRLLREIMVYIAQVQADRAGLVAMFAQGPAEALA